MSINKPIRVAQIMGKLWAGGVETVVFNYYREIDKTKIQFDFYYDSDSTIEPPEELINMGARFYKTPPYQLLPQYLRTLNKYFKENDYSIIHSHINTLSVFPLFIAWKAKIPVRIAHNHSVPGGKDYKRNALKVLLKTFAKIFSTHYFACSEKAGRWMFGNRTFEKGDVLVIRNAININSFRPDKYLVDLYKKKLNLENSFVVGNVGRFTYAKNHSFLLSIFTEICKLREDAILLLVGDGELHDEIVENTVKLNIMDRIIFVGQVSNPQDYYRLCNVMIIPSYFEGLSLTTIESQFAGVPVIISEAIPREAIISDGFQYHKLSDSASKWAKSAIEISKRIVNLSEKSVEYDISKRVSLLTDWYINHCEKGE